LQTNVAMLTLAASVGAKVPTARSFPSSPTAETRYVSTGSLVGSDPEGEATNTSFQSWEITTSDPVPSEGYALQARCRHEKVVAYRLQERGVDAFLPLPTEVHR
jgi:hypothetical protein